MNTKVMFVVGVGALVAGAAFLLMGIFTSQPGPAGAPGAESLQGELNTLRNESEELKAQIVSLQEQLAAMEGGAVPAGEGTPPGGGEAPGAAAPASRAEQVYRNLGVDFAKFAKFMAKMMKAEEEGRGPGGMMNDPEMLEMQADMMKLMANLQRELGISMEFLGGSLFMSLALEPLCKEVGVELSPEQTQKLHAMNTRIIEKLLEVKENTSSFEVERAYGRMVATREFGKGFENFLTEEQQKKLGRFGMGFGMGPGMGSSSWMSTWYDRPEKADEQAQAWQDVFGIEEDKHSGTLTSIAQEYLASYEDLEARYRPQTPEIEPSPEGPEADSDIAWRRRRYTEARSLTDQQKEEKEREMVQIEVEALKKISQLELTDEQREKVRKHNPFSPWANMRRNMRTSRMAANEASAVANLRTLSSAQELYNARHGRYAETLDELIKEQYIDSSLQGEKSGYTFELITVTKDEWYAIATPSDWSSRHFYIDQAGAIRYERGQAAGADSTPLGR